MPLQSDLAEFCVDLDISPGAICITMPGGAEVCAKIESNLPDVSHQVKQLFDTVNSALTPLVPIFDIIDTVVAVVDCVQAIPAALMEVPPNPAKIADCIPELAKKLDALLKLHPSVSIPILIVQVLDALILFLVGYRGQILTMIARAVAVANAQTRAATLGNVQLAVLLDCASANLDAELVNLNAGIEPIKRLIGLVNALAELAGLPCIPDISGVTELTEDALAPLDALIAFLKDLRSKIPISSTIKEGAGFSAPCED